MLAIVRACRRAAVAFSLYYAGPHDHSPWAILPMRRILLYFKLVGILASVPQ